MTCLDLHVACRDASRYSRGRIPAEAFVERRSRHRWVFSQRLILVRKLAKRANRGAECHDRGVGGGREQDLDEQLGLGVRDVAAIRGVEHRHPEPVRIQVLPVTALLDPREHRLAAHHRFVEQLVHRAHRRPHHVAERFHVLAPRLWQSEQVGQHLVDEGTADRRDGNLPPPDSSARRRARRWRRRRL
jgi:hypothetical protein